MKKTIKTTLPVALILCLILSVMIILSSCAGLSLEDFAKEQNELFEASKTDAMAISVKAAGKTLIYTIKYSDVTAATAQAVLDAQVSYYESILTTIENAGYDIDSIKLIIADNNGTELASHTITK